MSVEEAMDLSAGEDENDEPAELDTSTAVAPAMAPADPRLRVRATAAINLMPPWLPSRLRRWRLRRKGGRCLDCRSSLVLWLRRSWLLSARPTLGTRIL